MLTAAVFIILPHLFNHAICTNFFTSGVHCSSSVYCLSMVELLGSCKSEISIHHFENNLNYLNFPLFFDELIYQCRWFYIVSSTQMFLNSSTCKPVMKKRGIQPVNEKDTINQSRLTGCNKCLYLTKRLTNGVFTLVIQLNAQLDLSNILGSDHFLYPMRTFYFQFSLLD